LVRICSRENFEPAIHGHSAGGNVYQHQGAGLPNPFRSPQPAYAFNHRIAQILAREIIKHQYWSRFL
jgi:hypothetical protein